RRRHTRFSRDWSSDVCSSDLGSGTWKHLVMPAVTLGAYSTGIIARMTRSSMLDVIGHDYIRTARAKGLSERVVTYRHALRNALRSEERRGGKGGCYWCAHEPK